MIYTLALAAKENSLDLNSLLMILVPLLLISVMGLAFYFIMVKGGNSADKKDSINRSGEQSAQQLLNVLDVRDRFLYTVDGYIISYISVKPLGLSLITPKELANLKDLFGGELANVDTTIKFMMLPRTQDLSSLVDEYQELFVDCDNPIRRRLLQKEIEELNKIALTGEVVEQQYYISVWVEQEPEAERDLLKKIEVISKLLMNAGYKNEVLEQKQIIQFLNSWFNPQTAQFEHITDNEM